MKKITLLFLMLIFSAGIYVQFSGGDGSSGTPWEIDNESNIIYLSNWEHHKVLKPDSSHSHHNEIAEILASKNWSSFNIPNKLLQEYNKEFIWLKTNLPKWRGENSALYVGQVNYSMQVFLDEKMIYKWGSFSSTTNKYIRWHQNLITLPRYEEGTEVLFRIRLGNEFNGVINKIFYGSSIDIIKGMVRENISNIIFTILFYLTGLISLIFYFKLRHNKLLLGIALFLLPLGTFMFANTQTAHLIFNNPALFYHLNYLSLVSISVGVYFSIEQIVENKYKPLLNILWKLQLVFLIISILVDNMTNLIFYDLLQYRVAISIISMIIGMFALFKSTQEKSYEKRIFIIGISAYFISVIIEVIVLMNVGLHGDFGYHVRAMQYGSLVFVAVIGWGAVHNYVENYKQKEKLRMLELENIRLENEARYYYTSKLIELQEEERNRIALELHDSVGQKLILIKNQLLSRVKNSTDSFLTKFLTSISDQTGETIKEVRNITHSLRPQFLDQLGLKAAIEFMIEKISETSDIVFNVYIDEIDELFTDNDKINIFRIVQECLNNIIKHSRATEAFIKITKDDELINFEIKDNGIGIKDKFITQTTGIGITGMKERAKKINADLEFINNDMSGSTIKIKYKINRDALVK